MKIHVGPSKVSGRGVFASKRIAQGEVIENAPVIIIEEKDIKHISKMNLHNYWFDVGNHVGVLALGFGSLYNHSYTPNASYVYDDQLGVMVFTALRKIRIWEEIFVNYNGDHTDTTPVWFDTK
jgi:SET domain-containing protein